VHFLRGQLDRADGDCAAAVREFDVALQAPEEPWASEARAARADCRRPPGP
jgi:hypothetical protein